MVSILPKFGEFRNLRKLAFPTLKTQNTGSQIFELNYSKVNFESSKSILAVFYNYQALNYTYFRKYSLSF